MGTENSEDLTPQMAQPESSQERNPELKSRIINGLKAGSFAALEKAIDHPVAKFFVEGAKEAFKS